MNRTIPRSLIKTCAVAAIAAGALLALGFILHPANESAVNGTNPMWVPAHSLLWASFTIALLAWVGIYTVQAGSGGALGVAGFVVVLLGTSLASWVFSSDVTFVPVIAARAPDLFDRVFSPAHLALGAISVLSWVLGNVLSGITVLRARVLPSPAGVLLLIGTLLIPVAYLGHLREFLVAVGGTLAGAGEVWLGIGLLRVLKTTPA